MSVVVSPRFLPIPKGVARLIHDQNPRSKLILLEDSQWCVKGEILYVYAAWLRPLLGDHWAKLFHAVVSNSYGKYAIRESGILVVSDTPIHEVIIHLPEDLFLKLYKLGEFYDMTSSEAGLACVDSVLSRLSEG